MSVSGKERFSYFVISFFRLYYPQHFSRSDNFADGWEMTSVAGDKVGILDRERDLVKHYVVGIREIPLGWGAVGCNATAYRVNHSLDALRRKAELATTQNLGIFVDYILVVNGNDCAVKYVV